MTKKKSNKKGTNKISKRVKKTNKRISTRNNTKTKENSIELVNLKFKLNIRQYKLKEESEIILNNIFAVFTLHKDKKAYIAFINENSIDIDIIELLNNKKIKSLKGHERPLNILQYFINPKNTNKEYIISIDFANSLIIWDINNNYNIVHKILEIENRFLIDCLLYFPLSTKDDYIIRTIYDGEDECSKLYSFKTGLFIKNIEADCANMKTVLPWYNKKEKKDFIIQIAEEKIFINNIFEDGIYSELDESIYNFDGFIYNKNVKDYLCVSNRFGEIIIWDLYDKKLVRRFKIGNFCCFLLNWNNCYAIGIRNGLKIIDLEKGKVVEEIKNKIINAQRCQHPEYGNSLIAWDKKNISLWEK